MSFPIHGAFAVSSSMLASFALIKKVSWRIANIETLSFALAVMRAMILPSINYTPPKSAKTKRKL